MIRSCTLSIAGLLLVAGLAFADPTVEVRYIRGVPEITLTGSYPQSRYTVWRADSPDGPFLAISRLDLLCLGTCFTNDPGAEPGRTYWYRFDLQLANGERPSFGPYAVSIPAVPQVPLGARAFPNPGNGPTRVELSLPGTGRDPAVAVEARLIDLQGRLVKRLYQGILARGVKTLSWDGRDENGRELGPGAYFLRLSSPIGATTTRIVRVR